MNYCQFAETVSQKTLGENAFEIDKKYYWSDFNGFQNNSNYCIHRKTYITNVF